MPVPKYGGLSMMQAMERQKPFGVKHQLPTATEGAWWYTPVPGEDPMRYYEDPYWEQDLAIPEGALRGQVGARELDPYGWKYKPYETFAEGEWVPGKEWMLAPAARYSPEAAFMPSEFEVTQALSALQGLGLGPGGYRESVPIYESGLTPQEVAALNYIPGYELTWGDVEEAQRRLGILQAGPAALEPPLDPDVIAANEAVAGAEAAVALGEMKSFLADLAESQMAGRTEEMEALREQIEALQAAGTDKTDINSILMGLLMSRPREEEEKYGGLYYGAYA